MSQKEAAEKLNIGHRSYQRIESGEAVCDISFLHRFCYLLNLNFLDFISPYAPKPIDLDLFCSEVEIQKFQSSEFIQSSHFFYFEDAFLKDNSLEEDPKFLKNINPMLVWGSGKIKPNDAFCEIFDLKKNTSKRTHLIFNLPGELNFFDCIFYYNPKYLIKKSNDFMKNGVCHKVEFYSSVKYEKNDIVGILFIIKLIPHYTDLT